MQIMRPATLGPPAPRETESDRSRRRRLATKAACRDAPPIRDARRTRRAAAIAAPRTRRFGAESVVPGLTTASGMTVLVIIVAIAAFLIVEAIPALRANKVNFFTYQQWFPNETG